MRFSPLVPVGIAGSSFVIERELLHDPGFFGRRHTRASCLAAHAATIEHWTCQTRIGEKEYPQEWTLADNRMFAPKGKGSLSLVYSSDQVAVAYVRNQNDKPPAITHVFVFDKRAGKIIEYDDLQAGLAQSWGGKVEPVIQIFRVGDWTKFQTQTLSKLFETLTGRKATPDEMREMHEELNKRAGGNDLSSSPSVHERRKNGAISNADI